MKELSVLSFLLIEKKGVKKRSRLTEKNDCTFPRVAKTNHIRWAVMHFRNPRFVFDATLEMF